MSYRLPEVVDTSMRNLNEALQARLPHTIESFYVYGSTALNAYVNGSSDINFLVFVNRTLIPSDIQFIIEAHRLVELEFPTLDIMGAYIRQEDAGKSLNEIPPFPKYHDKTLDFNGNGDINPVTWRVLKKYGICIYGQQKAFEYEISSDELVQYVFGNMNTYWVGWIERLEHQLSLTDISEPTTLEQIKQLDFAVEWCTLGMLRQYYSIKEYDVISKVAAGEYGLKLLPDRWHGLIREAIAIKRLECTREYYSYLDRLRDLIELLRLIHTESTVFYNQSRR
ncbi:aminoglycoside adenylyltransferase domain-containing protein [Paenibacillus sp. GP183]|uniref:aminoglycoside adenylyltransferase domain-containing protein n=1 Tax=Paenibacillus sp. GP183 TaxID=1882751 RepID=UPI00089C7E2F|nr:aminoglycoside adenylyltransferase domain-containing protein [Paenibacillus sp. GP183]SEB57894.1 protein of unknown function [Paenibacillus sp. GP183]